MGTSTSSKGPGGNSPLVPPWADPAGNGVAAPVADPKRHSSFRRSLGKFVGSGDKKDLRRALGHYARSSTGGQKTAFQRFSVMAASGGALYSTFAGADANGSSPVPPFDLRTLEGLDIDLAIQRIIGALAPEGGDREAVAVAMSMALSQTLDADVFHLPNVSGDVLADLMVAYVRECVVQQVLLASNEAFQKALSPNQAVEAENDLIQLVHVCVDERMRTFFTDQSRIFTTAEMRDIQLEIVSSVWAEWEAY